MPRLLVPDRSYYTDPGEEPMPVMGASSPDAMALQANERVRDPPSSGRSSCSTWVRPHASPRWRGIS